MINGMYLTIQKGKDIVCNSNNETACELQQGDDVGEEKIFSAHVYTTKNSD